MWRISPFSAGARGRRPRRSCRGSARPSSRGRRGAVRSGCGAAAGPPMSASSGQGSPGSAPRSAPGCRSDSRRRDRTWSRGTVSRLIPGISQPSASSDLPLPYCAAVSIQLMPPANARRIASRLVASSLWMTMPPTAPAPKMTSETWMPERPKVRCFTQPHVTPFRGRALQRAAAAGHQEFALHLRRGTDAEHRHVALDLLAQRFAACCTPSSPPIAAA